MRRRVFGFLLEVLVALAAVLAVLVAGLLLAPLMALVP